jgi:hypothetical protein
MDEINQYVYSNKPIKALSLYINVYRSAMLLSYLEEFEDNKGVIIIRKSKDRQHNGQQKKYKRTNNDLQSITHKTKDLVTRTPLKTGCELTQVLRKGKQFRLHYWPPSCYSCFKSGDKSYMRKGPVYNYDKWNISLFTCDTDIM